MWMTRRNAVGSGTRRTLVWPLAILTGGCTGSSEPSTTPAEPSTTVVASTESSSPSPSPAITLGDFPAFPDQPFSDRVVASLQGVIDEAVEEFGGISAAVIVGDAGHWSGAAGIAQGNPLTAGSPLQIASIGKTVTAAQRSASSRASLERVTDLKVKCCLSDNLPRSRCSPSTVSACWRSSPV